MRASEPEIYNYVDNIEQIEPPPAIVTNKLEVEYKRFLVCSGMPEAAGAMLKNKGIAAIEDILHNILDLYTYDFSKYVDPVNIPRINKYITATKGGFLTQLAEFTL